MTPQVYNVSELLRILTKFTKIMILSKFARESFYDANLYFK